MRQDSDEATQHAQARRPAGVSAVVGAIVLAVESLGLFVLAGIQVVDFAGGEVGVGADGIALIVFTVVVAVIVGAFAVATWRGASWGRAGGIVAQLMILAVALGAVTGAYAQPLVGLALAIPAVVGVVALVLAVRRAAASRS